MLPSLTIGDFARATHLSVKTLRHYHQAGVLEPMEIDRQTGYRRYTTDQIPTAQVIRRLRGLDMPLEEVRAVLAASDVRTRNDLLAMHLGRLEGNLAKMQRAVASLRDLLFHHPSSSVSIEHRSVTETRAAAISEVVDVKDALCWYQGALGELHATLAAQDVPAAGPSGGIFSNDLFTYERGEATIFIPCNAKVRPTGRVSSLVIPAVELAVTAHVGSHADIDRAYGSLGTYVAQYALAIEGPLREYYVVGPHETSDETSWQTEIGWPIFQTGK